MAAVVTNSCNDTITQYNVQTGTASNTLNQVPPSATSGVPLISQGASAQPIFGTVGVAGGGTGDASFTPYSVITAGTTSTGSLQNVSGVGTSGQILTSNGASTLPTWQNASASGLGYVENVFGGLSNYNSSTTYYFSTSGITYTNYTVNSNFFIPISSTLSTVYGSFYVSGTLASSENVTVAIRVNNTTNINVSTTIKLNSTTVAFNNTGLSTSLNPGDYISFLIITPAWVTPPTSVNFVCTAYIS